MHEDTIIQQAPAGVTLDAIRSDVMANNTRTATNTAPSALGWPLHALPQSLQEVLREFNDSLDFPIDFTGSAMLFAASLAIGNTVAARFKTGWISVGVLFIACVGRPGTVKSPAVTRILKRLAELDSQHFSEYMQSLQKHKEDEKQFSLANKKDKQSGALQLPQKPTCKKLLISDSTPEAMMGVHRDNPRGIGLYADELAGWFKNFNRYSNGSEQEAWLSAWSNQTIRIERKSSEPILISDPFINVIGSIQPAVLTEMAKDGRGQNGFTDRILFAYPPDLKATPWSDSDMEPELEKRWSDVLDRLLDLELSFDDFGKMRRQEIPFSAEGYRIIKAWQARCIETVNEADDDQAASIQSKMQTYAIRFALILQMLYYACGEDGAREIGAKAVEGALALVEYYRGTAQRVHAIISKADLLEDKPENRRRFYDALPDAFTTAQAKTVGKALSIPDRTVERWLKDSTLFLRVSQGNYQKIA